jgi:hypothetical protein
MGVSGQRHASAALLPPGKVPPVPIGHEAGWAPEPVWTQRIEEKILCPRRGSNPDRQVVQPVVYIIYAVIKKYRIYMYIYICIYKQIIFKLKRNRKYTF